MITVDYVHNHVPNTFMVLLFKQDTDLALAFTALVEEKKHQLQGITVYGIRQSTGHKFRLKENLVPTIFQPRLQTIKNNQSWKLFVQPLRHPLTLQQKRDTSFRCVYAFPEERKKAVIHKVTVSVELNPLKMWFTVVGKYKPSRHAPEQTIQDGPQICPDEFTQALYSMFH